MGLPRSVKNAINNLEGAPSPAAFPSIALDTARNVMKKLVQRITPGANLEQMHLDLERNVVTGPHQ